MKFVLYSFTPYLHIKGVYSQASEAKADPNKISQYVPLDEEEHKEIDRLFAKIFEPIKNISLHF